MISDYHVYLAAVPAVFLYGLAKGGFGGSMSQLAVPLMALVMSPITAAAILLPVLIVMDLVAIYSYRGIFDRRTLVIMLPGALIGLGIGWMTARWVTPDQVRLLVGLIGLAFTADYLFGSGARRPARPQNRFRGTFWASISGFTSFVSHSGGPPFHMYVLPLRLEPRVLAGTATLFFATLNFLKVLPYLQLGQYTRETVLVSLILIPIAPVATRTGVYLVRVVDPRVFYKFAYGGIFLASLKLTYDGLTAIF